MNFVSKLQDELSRWKRAHAGMVRFMTKDHAQCLRTQLALRHSELIRAELEDERDHLLELLQHAANALIPVHGAGDEYPCGLCGMIAKRIS